jgi:hypothetical protein
MSESIDALHRANPRTEAGFDEAVDAVSRAVRVQLGTRAVPQARTRPRRRLARLSVVLAACAAVVAAVVSLSVGPSGAPNAAAAVRKAASVSASSAERSGTAVVRLTHDGDLWAGTTIRWHGDDLSVASDAPSRLGKAGSKLLVVGGTLYGIEPEHGGWLAMGRPSNIDPDSGTTPAEYLAAVREDVGGATLERITGAMSNPTTRQLADGSTVYSGAVRAGQIARETGFKGGQAIRVLPFGFVAHGAAADPASPLEVSVTVGADGIVRGIAVTWRNWSYRVGYDELGSTPALVTPANAPSLEQLRRERAARG